jgi:hypothetical protein
VWILRFTNVVHLNFGPSAELLYRVVQQYKFIWLPRRNSYFFSFFDGIIHFFQFWYCPNVDGRPVSTVLPVEKRNGLFIDVACWMSGRTSETLEYFRYWLCFRLASSDCCYWEDWRPQALPEVRKNLQTLCQGVCD